MLTVIGRKANIVNKCALCAADVKRVGLNAQNYVNAMVDAQIYLDICYLQMHVYIDVGYENCIIPFLFY